MIESERKSKTASESERRRWHERRRGEEVVGLGEREGRKE